MKTGCFFGVFRRGVPLFLQEGDWRMQAYLDNSATTKPSEGVIREMTKRMADMYYNPSSLYKEAFEIGESICSEAVSTIVTSGISDRVTVFNPYSKELSGYLKHEGRYYYVTDIPAKGYAARSLSESVCEDPVTVNDNIIENQYYIITLSECGEIASLYDKKENRQVFIEGRSANKLRIFEDLPGLRGSVNEDNWNLDPYYTEREFELSAPEKNSALPVWEL